MSEKSCYKPPPGGGDSLSASFGLCPGKGGQLDAFCVGGLCLMDQENAELWWPEVSAHYPDHVHALFQAHHLDGLQHK